MRRDILRALLATSEPMTVDELDELVPTANVSSLRYHVLVLEREECVTRAGEVVLVKGVLPAYAAIVTDNVYVIAILESIRQGDESR